MIYSEQTAAETAKHLLQINAIKLKPENPFTWASGWKSPTYPKVRDFLAENLAQQVEKLYGTDVTIAGVATGAIGIGMLVAEKLTGKSSLNAVAAIKEQQFEVLGMLALFSYGFSIAEENFAQKNISLHTLSNYDHLLRFANEEKAISNEQLITLSQWRKDPANWTP